MNVEELLTTVPDSQSDLSVPTERVAAAWAKGRRRHRRNVRSTSSAVIATVVLAVGVGASLVTTRSTARPAVLSAGPAAKTAGGGVCATVSAGVLCPDPALAAIELPLDEKYPHRTADRIGVAGESGNRSVLERFIQVDNIPSGTSGRLHSPGEELSITLSRAGAFPVFPDRTGRVSGYRVIRTLRVRGEKASLLQVGQGQSELRLNLGGFAVLIFAEQGPGHVKIHPDVPPQDLEYIVEKLELPDSSPSGGPAPYTTGAGH